MQFQQNLFDTSKYSSQAKKTKQPKPLELKRKYISSNRCQLEFRVESLDSALPMDHNARTVWKFVQLLDLSAAEKKISSLEDHTGRPAIAPEILVALWIYAISEGIVSARKIAKYCKDHKGFAWIAGGVPVGHHVLSAFRSKHCELFRELVEQSIAVLLSKGLIELKDIVQDGIKVQANASKQSYRRKKTLKMRQKEVKKYIKTLEDQQKKGVFESEERKRKERELVEAKKKEKSIKEAIKELNNHKNQKNAIRTKYKYSKLSNKDVSELRSSSTDPECRKMRMADGSFKLAYNFQIATDRKTELIVGVRVTQAGTDGGEMLRMYEKIKEVYKVPFEKYIVDSGYRNISDLDELNKEGVAVYMPSDTQKTTKLREKILNGEKVNASDATKKWIRRMETEEANEIYKERIRVAETPHAYFRNHGLHQLSVRGIPKVLGMVSLFCLTYNMTVIDRLF